MSDRIFSPHFSHSSIALLLANNGFGCVQSVDKELAAALAELEAERVNAQASVDVQVLSLLAVMLFSKVINLCEGLNPERIHLIKKLKKNVCPNQCIC